jgi:hypothetical protein
MGGHQQKLEIPGDVQICVRLQILHHFVYTAIFSVAIGDLTTDRAAGTDYVIVAILLFRQALSGDHAQAQGAQKLNRLSHNESYPGVIFSGCCLIYELFNDEQDSKRNGESLA